MADYDCRCCDAKKAIWFAVNNIPTHGHICEACYVSLRPVQLKQFYTRQGRLFASYYGNST